MRAALFGGTFDPIHCAHLRVASAAADAFSLDRVLFAPTGRQPLKAESAAASFEDRLAMVTLALGQPCAKDHHPGLPDPRFTVSSLDAPRPGGAPNYTVDLLEELARTMPAAALFAIAGADSFLSLPRWRSPGRVLALAQWIVVSRPGLDLTADFLSRPEFAPLALTPQQRARIHLLSGIHEDISATSLRRHLHETTEDLYPGILPASVAAYIREHHLYH
ncbi:MAG TPA: nicotinate (nicotinamide) nucleotide adenylyltransferase [Acidobacteriaceae bacterium]|nr:nicotinate (nicotinamide) nucleotide adenylyltransferase [Acidobacteriaceae bacterium]